jgi:hypothetical protein
MPGQKVAVDPMWRMRAAENHASHFRVSRKKNGRATFGGTAVGSHGSSSPALAWGQTLLVSGEEIVSADIYLKQALCLKKVEANPRRPGPIFFSFCDVETLRI